MKKFPSPFAANTIKEFLINNWMKNHNPSSENIPKPFCSLEDISRLTLQLI